MKFKANKTIFKAKSNLKLYVTKLPPYANRFSAFYRTEITDFQREITRIVLHIFGQFQLIFGILRDGNYQLSKGNNFISYCAKFNCIFR